MNGQFKGAAVASTGYQPAIQTAVHAHAVDEAILTFTHYLLRAEILDFQNTS